MIFSVYDYDKKRFRYYDALAGTPATGFFRKARTSSIKGSFVPESFAVLLPADAKPIGEGSMPKGYIAEDPRGLASPPLPGDASVSVRLPSLNVPVWAVLAIAVVSYVFGKNSKGSL